MGERRTPGGVKEALRIVSAYALVGILWILLSDEAAAIIFGHEQWTRISQFKGVGFILATSVPLYVLLRRAFASIRRSEQALTETRQQFAVFMENLPAGAFLKDADGRYVYVNNFWIKMFAGGRGADEIETVTVFPPEVADLFSRADAELLATRTANDRAVTIQMGDRQTDWLVTRFPVPCGPNGSILIGGFMVEMTEQRRLEAQLQHTARMEAVGRLAGGVAHDFNNMLTVINGYAELLAMRLKGTPHEQQAREIRAAGDRAAELTRQLLAFSRKQVLELAPLNLNEVLQNLARMLRSALGSSVRLELDLAQDLPLAVADRSKVEQAILNLAVNARDAMPAGGECRVTTRAVELVESPGAADQSFTPGKYVEVAVRDTGEGMSKTVLAHLFEPFFTTKPKGKGTGLGLATVYGLVKQSGGTIAVESAPGEGATFRLYLPSAA